MKTFVFQGDSITDAGRSRDNDDYRGNGYPTLVAARLGADRPGQLRFLNRGVSGDRVVDVNARIRRDLINLKPDYISILIGINDVWHELETGNGVEADRFEQVYDMLLSYTIRCLPNVKLMVLEPFVALGRATEKAWDTFRTETALRARAAERVAQKHGAVFVPLQAAFERAFQEAPADFWLIDGVHPTQAGHMLISRTWMDAFRKQGWL